MQSGLLKDLKGEIKIGHKIYAIGDKIGQGTYGKVFVAFNDGIQYAIKICGVEASQRMRNLEIQKLNIPVLKMCNSYANYNKIYDLMVFPKYTQSLNFYVTQKNCSSAGSLKLFLQIFIPVVKGIKILHHNGIAHGDLKLSNILFKQSKMVFSDLSVGKNKELKYKQNDVYKALYSFAILAKACQKPPRFESFDNFQHQILPHILEKQLHKGIKLVYEQYLEVNCTELKIDSLLNHIKQFLSHEIELYEIDMDSIVSNEMEMVKITIIRNHVAKHHKMARKIGKSYYCSKCEKKYKKTSYYHHLSWCK